MIKLPFNTMRFKIVHWLMMLAAVFSIGVVIYGLANLKPLMILVGLLYGITYAAMSQLFRMAAKACECEDCDCTDCKDCDC